MVISILVVILTAYLGLTGCVATLDDSQNEDGQQKRAEPKQNTTHKSKQSSEPAVRNKIAIDSNTSDDSDGNASNDSDDESSDERSRRLHIESLGQLKSAKLKSIESKLTEEQRQAEKE
ncbi:AGAP010433-PA-like protein [Anopheles sinensis]|uniref:AGAP010433-PA-like protein n=1 Tax=Anopheles sinensis TaxID=74873 RepID=A0A084VZI3_ANOSI|nr:AGAP010433-PA-like protein [Anopheles sinensis]